MEAIVANRSEVHVVNARNGGAIPNLPDDAVVEVLAEVNGLRGHAAALRPASGGAGRPPAPLRRGPAADGEGRAQRRATRSPAGVPARSDDAVEARPTADRGDARRDARRERSPTCPGSPRQPEAAPGWPAIRTRPGAGWRRRRAACGRWSTRGGRARFADRQRAHRPRRLGGGAGARPSPGGAGRGVWPRVGDLLVSDRGDGARALGGQPRRPALGQRQRGDPVARRRGAPGPVLRLARPAHRRPRGRGGDRRRTAGARGRDGLQQLGRRRSRPRPGGRSGTGRPLSPGAQLERGRGSAPRPGRLGAAHPMRAGAPRPGGLAPPLGPRDPAPAGGRGRAGARRRLGGRAARRAEPVLQRLGGGRARDVGAGRGDSRRAARQRGPASAPPGVRGRPRAHRHGLGVADGRDPPQARPHGGEPARADRPLPRLPLRRLVGAALRLAPGGRPAALLARARGGGRRQLGGRRRLLGRAGLQPPQRRVADPPALGRPALVRGAFRAPVHDLLEPRHLRPQRSDAPDPPPVRHRALHDPEALVEPVHPAASRQLSLARDRRLGGARSPAAGRHLQRRPRARPAAALGGRVSRPRPQRREPDPVRPRRRRRRPDPGDARVGGPGHRPARPAAGRALDGRAVLRRRCRASRRAGDDRRAALLRVPPRHVHEPSRDEARQPRRRARPARGRGGGRDRLGARGRRVSGRRARLPVAGAAAQPVPRHPPRDLAARGPRDRGGRAALGP